MAKNQATQPVAGDASIPNPTLSPEQLNAIVGNLKDQFGPMIAGMAQAGASADPNQVQGLVDLVASKVNQTKEEAFKSEYPYFDQANDLWPQVIGGGDKGIRELVKKNAAAKAAFEPISSGVAYARSRQLCPTGRAVNWAAETNVLGDVMYVLAAIGVVGGLVFLGKMAYDAWIA